MAKEQAANDPKFKAGDQVYILTSRKADKNAAIFDLARTSDLSKDAAGIYSLWSKQKDHPQKFLTKEEAVLAFANWIEWK